MKRYFKYFGLCICVTVLLLTLTSCFTSSVSYIEWEFSNGTDTVTDGKTVYERYDGALDHNYIQTNNNTFFYSGQSNLDNTYIEVSRPLKDEDILYISFFGNEYMDHRQSYFYTTPAGATTLRKLEGGSLEGESYLLDTDTNESAPLTEGMKEAIANILASEENTVTVSSQVLNNIDQIEVVSYELGGFMKQVHGVFFFNKVDIYYLDTTDFTSDMRSYYGNLTDYEYEVKKVDDLTRNVLSENYEMMDDVIFSVEYEEPTLNESDADIKLKIAKLILAIVAFGFGILFPSIPLTLTLIGAIKKRWKAEAADYVLLGASAVWIISGIVILILILV